MKDVGIFYGLLVYFTAIKYILWTFGRFYGYVVDFSTCWYRCCTDKNLASLVVGESVSIDSRESCSSISSSHLRENKTGKSVLFL
jgi:hypothetical protein